MAKKTGRDILDLDDLLGQIDKLIVGAKELRDVFKQDITEALKEIKKLKIGDSDSIKSLNEQIAELQKKTAGLNTVNAERKALAEEQFKLTQKNLKGKAQLSKANSKLAKDNAIIAEKRRLANKQAKDAAKQSLGLVGAYAKESKNLITLRKKYKDLAIQNQENTKVGRSMLKEITRLDTKLKEVDKTVGQSQRHVGDYGRGLDKLRGSFRKLAAVAGISLGVGALNRVMRNSIGIIRDFEQSQADLASVLGKSRDDIKALTDSAKQYGASTRFTASEVAGLQKEFAKLGFKEEEILNATEATLNLAAATGTELADASKIVGSSLRAFGLDASETGRIVDVFAKATSASALDMSFLETAMSTVAPVAKAMGFSVEDTTALLGSLADAGFDASTAATSTKNILLNLANTSGSLAKKLGKPVRSLKDLLPALKKLKDEGTDLNETLQLTDKRSVAAFNTFLEGTESTKKLNDALNQAGGTAQKMADEQLDTLNGQMDLLNSAWEGFVLSVESGDGVISRVLKDAIKFAQGLLEKLTQLNETGLETSDRQINQFVAERAKDVDKFKAVFDGLSDLSAKQLGEQKDKILEGLDEIGDGMDKSFQGPLKGAVEDFIKLRQQGVDPLKARLNTVVTALRDLDFEKAIRGDQLKSVADDSDRLRINAEAFAKGDLGGIISDKDRTNIKATVKTTEEAIRGLNELASESLRALSDEELAGLKLLRGQSFVDDEIQRRKELVLTVDETNDSNIKSTKKFFDAEKEIRDRTNDNIENEKNQAIAKEDARNEDRLKALKKLSNEGMINVKQFDELVELEAIQHNIRLLDIDKKFAKKRTEVKKGEIERIDAARLKEEKKALKILEDNLKQELDVQKEIEQERELKLLKSNATSEELSEKQLKAKIKALNEEIEIQQAHGKKALDLQIELAEAERDLKKSEQDKEIEAEKQFFETLNTIADSFADLRNKRDDEELKRIDKKIADIQKRQDTFRALAESGDLDAEKSIAAEIKREQKLEKEKERIQKRAQHRELFLAAFKGYSAKIESGDQTPVKSTIRDLAFLTAAISGLSGFIEGTEGDKTIGDMLGKPHLNTFKDQYVIRADGRERIMNPDQSNAIRGYTNDEVAGIVEDHRKGMTFTPFENFGVEKNYSYVPMTGVNQDMRVVAYQLEAQKGILQQIADKPVYMGLDIDKQNELMIQLYNKNGDIEKIVTRLGDIGW